MHDYHPPLLRLVFLFPALLNLMNTLLVNFSYFNVLIALLNLNLLILYCSLCCFTPVHWILKTVVGDLLIHYFINLSQVNIQNGGED